MNLRRRPDRRAHIAAQLPAGLSPVYTSDWDGPFDGRSLSLDQLDRGGYRLFPWEIESDNPWWSRPLKYGEIGCSLAHLACWRHAAELGADYTLVLEDDAVTPVSLLDTLLTRLKQLGAPAPFELLYLGRFPLYPDQPAYLPDGRPIDGMVTPGYSHCTFAYLLTRAGLDAVLSARLESAVVPVDEFLPALYHPHPRLDLQRRFPPCMRALAFEPALVTQRDKNDAGSDTEDSPFVTEPAGDYLPSA
ncbi:glycosyltransferase family 25 protein [Pseudonocardia acaciae]|uniref:glycosyltransferase family 25 protein n=1 Tax=Pseudonocardia acaciae TaxID=551276 RepID=UPI0006842933|nr:glycosyltransferase family 25 protein [Pseudonocardia acaciae]